ncbi:hypothetical protein TrCOL_g5970 [Triparma columacea]|uniref:Sialidase domain-containing protein n=1 Tax=Triparma columacea TaxID=722753 RepID=A0A9W7LDZ5_9STRA|nr:hypothetical protein TrCOL_g5970 [Triparma columacea]
MWESSNQTFCSDESASNIVMRRSEDSGKTWGEPVVVIGSDEGVGEGEHAERHTWSIFDSVNEKVFLFTNRNVNGPTGCDCGVAYKTSADGGDTWGDLIDLDEGDVYGMGLAHGITHHTTGRMVGCMRKICRNSCPPDYASRSFYSDDGSTWVSSDFLHPGTTECSLVELSDGRLYLNSRPYKGWDGELNRRLVSYSDDVGESWGDVMVEESLIDYGFADQGGMASDGPGGRLAFVHPYSEERMNMTFYRGGMDEEGVVRWDNETTEVIYGGESEYSDVAFLGGEAGGIGVLFERDAYDKISFKVIEW